MKFYSFEIVIEKEPEDEGYSAYSPRCPACFSNGRRLKTQAEHSGSRPAHVLIAVAPTSPFHSGRTWFIGKS